MSYSASRDLAVVRRRDDPTLYGRDDDDAFPRDVQEQHEQLTRWFEESETARQDEMQLAERDRDYTDHIQWTREELDALKKRGQPPIIINKIKDKVSLLCGLERKARTDPKAFARTPDEEDRADAATQALRYIADDNNFSLIRSAVYENMLVEGFGAAELGLEDDGQGGANITITDVPWDRVWYDPHSRALDFSDARYVGLVIWMDRDQLLDMYPDADDVIESSFSTVEFYYDDRPDMINWTDNRRQRVRVVQCHWSDAGAWWQATYTKQGLLAPPQKSPFKDRRGKSACGLLLQSSYINRENQRYGMVRGLISIQDEINKRRSKALHLLSVRQVVTETGAVADEDKARREVARPDGFVVVNPGMRFEIEPAGELANGQFQLLQHATAEMQLSGPNAAMSGTDSRELSGRAVLAQQAGGAVQNEPLADALRMWSRRVYEMAWMAARQYWTGGKWVRVTDDLGATRWVGINQPITVRDKLAEMPDQQRAAVMQQMQIVPGDPRLQQVVGVQNDITDLDVDITIQEGIDIPSIQAEQFQSLVQLASVQPGLIPGDVLIAASGLKDKEALLERMKEHQQQQQQTQQKAGALAEQHAQADIASKQAKAQADMALAQERKVNSVKGIHDVHAEFAAPPYGQPFQAPPDAPSAPGTAGASPIPARASGGLVTRTLREPMVAPRTVLGEDQAGFGTPPSWMSGLPRYSETDPNFREFGTGDAGRMAFINRRLGLPPQLSGAGDPPLYPTPPGQLPPTADRNTLPPGWEYVPPLPEMSHAAGGPIAGMMGGDPPGPDDGFITAKEGEYVMQRGAVARYGQQIMDMINSGEIDPKVLQTAAAHAEADLRAKNAKAAVDEAKALQTAQQVIHARHDAVNTIADTHAKFVTANRLMQTPIPQPAPPSQGA